MRNVGYALFQERLRITAVPVVRPALVQPTTRIEEIAHTLAVPSKMAPDADDLLGNVLFALKHEGINLSILAQVLPCVAMCCSRRPRGRTGAVAKRGIHPEGLLPVGSLHR